jgi:hypothetical protein
MKTFFKRRWYFFIPLFLAAGVAFGFIVVALWNYTMPVIFKLPEINFWQAICLLILSRILFGCGPRGHHRHRGPFPGVLRDKWEKMSPEEREKLYQRLHSRWRPGDFQREGFERRED